MVCFYEQADGLVCREIEKRGFIIWFTRARSVVDRETMKVMASPSCCLLGSSKNQELSECKNTREGTANDTKR